MYIYLLNFLCKLLLYYSHILLIIYLSQGKNDKHAVLDVKAMPDNYVYLESRESPGSFLAFQSNGKPRNPKEVSASDPDAQFFVRVTVSYYTEKNSKLII